MKKPIIYIDLDGVLADFKTAYDNLVIEFRELNFTELKPEDEVNFEKMKPMPDAISSFIYLSKKYDVFIASTAPWDNAEAWQQKREWVEEHLGEHANRRLILTHRKDLLRGDFLIDDRTANGAGEFQGELIQFGTPEFPNWQAVINYFIYHAEKIKNQTTHTDKDF